MCMSVLGATLRTVPACASVLRVVAYALTDILIGAGVLFRLKQVRLAPTVGAERTAASFSHSDESPSDRPKFGNPRHCAWGCQ
jgi:hypothetical protein